MASAALAASAVPVALAASAVPVAAVSVALAVSAAKMSTLCPCVLIRVPVGPAV
nr:hypothetical protein [Parafrankia sp. CH37]